MDDKRLLRNRSTPSSQRCRHRCGRRAVAFCRIKATFRGSANQASLCWQSFLNSRGCLLVAVLRAADPVARHAKWVSSPALETLLPRLHQNARDLLADLAAARGAAAAAAAAAATATTAGPTEDDVATGTAGSAAITDAAEDRGGPIGKTSSRSSSSSSIAEGDRKSSRGAALDGLECTPCIGAAQRGQSMDPACRGWEVGGAAPAGAAVRVGGWAAASHGAAGKGVEEMASVRKENKTLRIVVDALREKDEDSQVRGPGVVAEAFAYPWTAEMSVVVTRRIFSLLAFFVKRLVQSSCTAGCRLVRCGNPACLLHRSVLARINSWRSVGKFLGR